MENVRVIPKAIDLAHHIDAKLEDVVFNAVMKTCNGAVLWCVYDTACNETRYVMEGENGELMQKMECTEEEAIAEFSKF